VERGGWERRVRDVEGGRWRERGGGWGVGVNEGGDRGDEG